MPRTHRGLCPQCHGYDEKNRCTACVCNDYDMVERLKIERDAIVRNLSVIVSRYDKQIGEIMEVIP